MLYFCFVLEGTYVTLLTSDLKTIGWCIYELQMKYDVIIDLLNGANWKSSVTDQNINNLDIRTKVEIIYAFTDNNVTFNI